MFSFYVISMMLVIFLLSMGSPAEPMRRHDAVQASSYARHMAYQHTAANEHILRDDPGASGIFQQSDLDDYLDSGLITFEADEDIQSAADGSGFVVTWMDREQGKYPGTLTKEVLKTTDYSVTSGRYDGSSGEIRSHTASNSAARASVPISLRGYIPDGAPMIATQN